MVILSSDVWVYFQTSVHSLFIEHNLVSTLTNKETKFQRALYLIQEHAATQMQSLNNQVFIMEHISAAKNGKKDSSFGKHDCLCVLGLWSDTL